MSFAKGARKTVSIRGPRC